MAADPSTYPMIPEDLASTPDQELAAAIASRLDAAPAAVPLPGEDQVPFGRTWNFDFESGRFVWVGGSPGEVHGHATLEQWCLMAIHTARFQYDAFDDDFGMEGPSDPIGELATAEVVADWQADLVETLMQHDRVSAVQNIDLDWDPTEAVLTILQMDVVTDESTLTLAGVQVQTGGSA